REMIDFLVTEKKLSRDDAYMLSSVAADFSITQLVDGTKGVHAMIPKAIFQTGAARGVNPLASSLCAKPLLLNNEASAAVPTPRANRPKKCLRVIIRWFSIPGFIVFFKSGHATSGQKEHQISRMRRIRIDPSHPVASA